MYFITLRAYLTSMNAIIGSPIICEVFKICSDQSQSAPISSAPTTTHNTRRKTNSKRGPNPLLGDAEGISARWHVWYWPLRLYAQSKKAQYAAIRSCTVFDPAEVRFLFSISQ